ncbi:MAG: DUF1385 domain-containing protein [Lachnospiraceae bacterium]|nr:DUF1385 domain-containing protein [Lachnospiraceae bacterium]
MKSSGIGGQAVLEGIMMKNQDRYAVAVRKPDQEIEVCVKEYKSIAKGRKLLNLPFIRGIFSFIDSLVLGMSTLMYSSQFYEEEEENETGKKESENEKELKKSEKNSDNAFKDTTESVIMTVTVIFSVILALGLFVVLPSLISDFAKKKFAISSYTAVAVIESVIKLILFLLYIILISRMEDIQRTFMYHGAEHKCINCIEHGNELNVENVLKSSRLHKRCGTSFLFLVMAISIVFFIMIPVQQPALKILVRLLLIPVIAGVSYEVLRFAGSHDNLFVKVVSAPGLALQKLTTKEPDPQMAEVAIKAVEAVFDWREYLKNLEEDEPEK